MTFIPPLSGLRPGLTDPALDSQRLFRVILDALAAPGRIHRLPLAVDPPAPLPPAAAAICLTLADADTPLWLDAPFADAAVTAWLRFHCGCPIVADPAAARFAVVASPATAATLEAFPAGDPLYPDRSATLIVAVAGMRDGATAAAGVTLSGPGIAEPRRLDVDGVGGSFWPFVAANHRRYPLGVDLFCVAGTAVVGLPRSTRVDG